MITDYKLVGRYYEHELATAVNDLITEGWQPLGRAFLGNNGYKHQTMVKYAPPKEVFLHLDVSGELPTEAPYIPSGGQK